MSRSQDLVGIATGDVRVSVSDLSVGKRIHLFDALALVVCRHYEGLHGGSRFISWHTENFGEKLTERSVRRYSLAIDESLYPKSEEYNTETRIVSLTSHYFRLPEFKLPENGCWNFGDTKLVARICLTQHGNLYLEWYRGKIRAMNEVYKIPGRVVVDEAKYIEIPRFLSIDERPSELKTFLEKAPEVLYSFGFACMHLLKNEEECRRQRADHDAKAFAKLSNVGRIFGITYP